MEELEVETLTPEQVGKVLHKSAELIRAGLRQGKFAFGTAIEGKTGQWTYIIIKKKFLKWIEEEGVDKDALSA